MWPTRRCKESLLVPALVDIFAEMPLLPLPLDLEYLGESCSVNDSGDIDDVKLFVFDDKVRVAVGETIDDDEPELCCCKMYERCCWGVTIFACVAKLFAKDDCWLDEVAPPLPLPLDEVNNCASDFSIGSLAAFWSDDAVCGCWTWCFKTIELLRTRYLAAVDFGVWYLGTANVSSFTMGIWSVLFSGKLFDRYNSLSETVAWCSANKGFIWCDGGDERRWLRGDNWPYPPAFFSDCCVGYGLYAAWWATEDALYESDAGKSSVFIDNSVRRLEFCLVGGAACIAFGDIIAIMFEGIWFPCRAKLLLFDKFNAFM